MADGPLSIGELNALDAYWRAANYLTVGQIYLQENPLLREPLRAGAHQAAAARPLGHLARASASSTCTSTALIRERDVERASSSPGPGHGGPGRARQRLPRGHVLRDLSRRSRGTRRGCGGSSASSRRPAACRATSSPPTPGSIHEGGELGYVLTHAFGAAFDNPDLLVASPWSATARRRPGRSRARGRASASSNPARDGAVLPILHLNGYKISGPTVLGRATRRGRSRALLEGHGYDAALRRGRRADARAPARSPPRSTRASIAIRAIQQRGARSGTVRRRGPRWPAIVLRTPKGWTGPEGGRRPAGRGDVPRAPGAARRGADQPGAARDARSVDAELPAGGAVRRAAAGSLPRARRARAEGRPPHGREPARQRRRGSRAARRCPTSRATRVDGAAARRASSTSRRGSSARCCATSTRSNPQQLPPLLPGRDELQPARRRLRGREPLLRRAHDRRSTTTSRRDGRVMEVLSEHNCEGWLEGYVLTGRHGLFATYEAFALIVASMATQHAKWLEACARAALARAGPLAQHPAHLDLLAQRPQRLQPPGAGLHGHDRSRRRGPSRASTCRRTPTACSRVADHCLRSHELREPDRHRQAAAAAVARHGRGARALRARRLGLGVGRATSERRRARRRARLRGRHRRRWRRWPPRAWLREQRAGAAGARGQRRRPDGALPARASIRTA